LAALCAHAAAPEQVFRGDATSGRLAFEFEQAGALAQGQFRAFNIKAYRSGGPNAQIRYELSVAISSVDTGDAERDGLLRGPDLFAAEKFPEARFVSAPVRWRPGRPFDLSGTLTLRGVSRPIRLRITPSIATGPKGAVLRISGAAALKRLDYGVGQGEWRATEWVADRVAVTFDMRLPAQ
jgi:polyisoprenoid-binding protein YceI